MRATRWTGYLLLPLALLLERFTWFAMRSILWEHAAGPGAEDADSASTIVRTVSWLVVLSPIAGAAVGWFVGARRTLLFGMFGLCAGYLLLAVDAAGMWPGAVVVALSLGLVRPAFLAVAAAVSPDPDETPRTTLFLLLYAMTTLAAIGGPALASAFRPPDYGWMFDVALVPVILATALAAIHLRTAKAQGSVELEAPDTARPIAGAAWILGLLVVVMCVLRIGGFFVQQGPVASQMPGLLHPIAVLIELGVIGLVWVGLSAGGTRVRAFSVSGVGLVLLSLAPFLVAVSVANVSWRYRDIQGFATIGATANLAIGEAWVLAFLMSRICASTPARLSVAFAAAWLLTTSAMIPALSLLPAAGDTTTLLVQGGLFLAACVVCLVTGISLLARRKRVRVFFEGSQRGTV